MESIWQRRSVRVFLAIGFGLPWLGWTIVAVTGMTSSPLRTVLFYMGDFMTVAGLVATVVAGGTGALRAMLRRCLPGGGLGWWVFALLLPLGWQLAARVIYLAAHGGLGSFEIRGLAMFVSAGSLLAFTTGPLGEEAGWRGFLLPRLLSRYQPLKASFILGGIWALWHYALYVKSVFASVVTGAQFTGSVICFTVLMTILFHRTRGNLLLAVLFHWAVNVTPEVANALLPASETVPHAVLANYELAALALATAVFATVVGWDKLGRKESFEPVRDLAAEAIAEDRAGT